MSTASTYLETRHHELRKTRLAMVDGNLTANLRSVQAGVSARAYLRRLLGLCLGAGHGGQ